MGVCWSSAFLRDEQYEFTGSGDFSKQGLWTRGCKVPVNVWLFLPQGMGTSQEERTHSGLRGRESNFDRTRRVDLRDLRSHPPHPPVSVGSTASTQWSSTGFKVFFAPEISPLDLLLPSSSPLAINDDGDDMSTGSRSSSSLDSMQVDDDHVYKYDEYARGYEKDVATIDTRIPSSNKGFGLLMGRAWGRLATVRLGGSCLNDRRSHH